MPNRIPEGICAQHILAAIEDLDRHASHPFGESTKYDLLFNGRRYPPKAVIGIAAGKLPGGVSLGPYDFKGGLESKCFEILEENGFTVVPKPDQQRGSQGNPEWTRDELIIALDVYLRTREAVPAKNSEEIHQLSATLNRLGERLFTSEQRTETFRNTNGVYMKLMNFRRFDPAYTRDGKIGLSGGNALEEEIWNQYSGDPAFCFRVAHTIIASLDDPDTAYAWSDSDDNSIEEASEGRLLTRKHFVRERNRRLVQKKINRVLRSTGKLECEVCTFNFASRYGTRGHGFIECHHTKPVAFLEDGATTRIEDLALVCSNCHRMIHRTRPWLTLDELRAILRN